MRNTQKESTGVEITLQSKDLKEIVNCSAMIKSILLEEEFDKENVEKMVFWCDRIRHTIMKHVV